MEETSRLYIDTLTESEIARIEAKLRPGQSSMAGFLGADESLKEVIYGDASMLSRLGLTHGRIADKLQYIVDNSKFPHGFDVMSVRYRGFQEDPFHEGLTMFSHSSEDFTITNSDGQAIRFPGLIIRLIREYQFFEGRQSPYRLDPEEAARVLKLTASV